MSEMIPEKKNNTARNILIAVGVVVALCACVAVAGYFGARAVGSKVTAIGTELVSAVKKDPTEIAQVASNIADFDMPPGYQYEMAMSFLSYETVALSPIDLRNGYFQIMLVQTPNSSNASQQDLQAQAQQMSSQQSSGGSSVVVGTRTEKIRGQDVIITISESSGGRYTYRTWTAFFNGKGGLTILMIQGQADHWDDQVFLNFIHSIR